MRSRMLTFALFVAMLLQQTQSFKTFFKEKINEEQPSGTVILRIASSLEISNMVRNLKSKTLEFTLLDSMDSRFFSCNKHSSLITTQVRLDREGLCSDSEVKHCCDPKSANPDICNLQFQITAKSDSKITLIQIVVELEDINDNTPSFQKLEETLFIKENIQLGEIQRFKVTDPDSKKYSTKSIEMKASNFVKEYFSLRLDEEQVKLILKKQLDRESTDHFRFVIIAMDRGESSNTGTITVNVNVTDVNDNPPKWVTESYTTSVKEDLPINSLVLTLKAEDKDIGNNGNIFYEFDYLKNEDEIKLRNLFLLNSVTGELRIQQKIDYEQLPSPEIKLNVLAKDNGEELVHTINAVISVRVIDINDNPPTIMATSLSYDKLFKVKENVGGVQQVASISVRDPDTGKGGEIHCEIDNKNFQLVPLNNPLSRGFSLVSQKSMDREEKSTYSIIVTCSDFGHPSLTSTRMVNIMVQDDNDNTPKFQTSSFHFKIRENNALGQYIGKINATDQDIEENGQIKFSLSTDAENVASIDVYTGALSAAKEFDREFADKYVFVVFAKDGGSSSLSSSSTVSLTIIDANDHDPKFENTYFFNVIENSYPGIMLGKVEATDQDVGENARIIYHLIGKYHHFGINQDTGAIMLQSGTLDREKVSNFDLKVMASDCGQPSRRGQTTVHIIVDDLNDNPPSFIFPSYKNNQVNVSCNEIPNQIITRVIANDSDYGISAEISYLILPFPTPTLFNTQIRSNNYQSLFDIDSNGGQVFLTNKFPTCTFSYEIKLPIRAVDHGTPALSSTSYLIINVISDNSYKKQYINNRWPAEKKSHWTAIISLIVATAVLIFLLFAILCLLKRKYASNEANYRKGQTKPDFSHTVERPGANDSGKITSDEEDATKSPDYRNLGTYVGFPTNYYTIGSRTPKMNNNADVTTSISLHPYTQRNDLSQEKNTYYQTLSGNIHDQYSPLSISRNPASKQSTILKTNNSNQNDTKLKETFSLYSPLSKTISQASSSQAEVDDANETIANPMVATYCSVSFV